MDADGNNVRRLTNMPGGDEYPSWSPDGSQIAFFSERGGIADTYIMDTNGRNAHRLAKKPIIAVAPVWSPDGTEIAFWSSYWGGLANVGVIGADGTNIRNLTNSLGPDQWLSWVNPTLAISPMGKSPQFWGWLKGLGR